MGEGDVVESEGCGKESGVVGGAGTGPLEVGAKE